MIKKIKPLFIYVAGALSKDGVVKYVQYMKQMCDITDEIYRRGHYPFCPAIDFLLGFNSGIWEEKDYKNLSLAWLERCDAIFTMANSLGSKGVAKELERAKELRLIYFKQLIDIPNLSDCSQTSYDWENKMEKMKIWA